MLTEIQTGNAQIDTTAKRGWLVGDFIEEKFGLRHTDKLEVKWGVLKAGDARQEWATNETKTSIGILISGSFIMEFRDQTLRFDTPGDYVMWGPGVDHLWRAPEDAVWLTIRWP